MNAQLTPALSNPDLDSFWMPFTANRQFKSNPRLLARAEGMYYWTADGREILDGVAADLSLLQPDGLHPNAAGVGIIVKRILPKVEELVARVRAQKPS